jgi:hypothetical protein
MIMTIFTIVLNVFLILCAALAFVISFLGGVGWLALVMVPVMGALIFSLNSLIKAC